MTICRSMVGVFLVGTIVPCATGVVCAQARIEIRPVETTTVTTTQFLLGDPNGRPTTIAGELRFPATTDGKLPAVVLVHGSGGLRGAHSRWADELNSIGVAAVVLDSFTGRGITSTVNDQSQLDTLAMMVDAYRVLGVLARDARIDSDRIAVMGFSKGAVAAVYSSNERFRRMWAPRGVQFAAHIGLYTPCGTTYRDDDKLTGKPLRLFRGVADDYVPIGPCREYVLRLQRAGVDVSLTEFAGAYHTYDDFSRKNEPQPFQLVNATTSRNCQLAEADGGVILNTITGRPYDLTKDPCLEKGPHIAYNEAATAATVNAVKRFLTTVFKLKTEVAK
jgi:dienelactone hydrolase